MPVLQTDIIKDRKEKACILTLDFIVSSFIIAVSRDYDDGQLVIDFFNYAYASLDKEMFIRLFSIILADNGLKFSNPKAFEFNKDVNKRTHVFIVTHQPHMKKGWVMRSVINL